jgi:hypothetical protein
MLADWEAWTSGALGPIPGWPEKLPHNASKFCARTIGAVLTGRYPDLERATLTLARTVHEAARYFQRHASLLEEQGRWQADRFYKNLGRWDPTAYEELLGEWNCWVDECHALVVIATKAANWFAEEVRRSLNPLFFLEGGKFLVTHGPDFELSYVTELHEFTPAEKAEMPQAILHRVRDRDKGRFEGA